MKTWEMIKALTENPTLKFVAQDTTTAEVGTNGCLVLKIEDRCRGEVRIFSDLVGIGPDDWELIPQEVPWQEAIQAYLNKKDIRIECDGEIFLQSQYCKLGAFSNTDYKGIDEKLFRKGKWFIL